MAFDNTNREGDSTVVKIPRDSDSDGELHFFAFAPYFCIVFISFVFYYFMACSVIPMIVMARRAIPMIAFPRVRCMFIYNIII